MYEDDARRVKNMTEIKDNEIENEVGKKKSRKSNHWIKLPIDFFDKKEIRLLLSRENGYEEVVRYLKLLLYSTPNDGIIKVDGICDDIETEIAWTIKEEGKETDIAKELEIFEKLKLVEFENREDNQAEFIMTKLVNMVGQGESTKRVQEHRARKKIQEMNQLKKEVEESKDDAKEKDEEQRLNKYYEKRQAIKENKVTET